ncbi:hypothetical protein O1L60_21250 [Streptomyces diastatochromogenes]|nr:hypothetical protein [Streptomyces diastatochromogenes]
MPRAAGGPLPTVECVDRRLRLAPLVEVDLHLARCRAQDAIGDRRPPEDPEGLSAALGEELLPRWPDEWLVLERERWDQLRLHALEGWRGGCGGTGSTWRRSRRR